MSIADSDFRKIINSLRSGMKYTRSIAVIDAADELPPNVAQTVSAFSNSSGGVMLLGLNVDSTIEPSPGFDPERIEHQLLDLCANHMTPPAHVYITKRDFRGSAIIIAEIAEIIPREKPCFITQLGLTEGSFFRDDDGRNRDLTSLEIECLEENKIQPRDDIAIVEGATIEDLDDDLVDELVERRRELHPRLFSKLDTAEIMRDLHIIARDRDGVDRPTVSGLVALGNYPQKYFPRLAMRLTVYRGLGGSWDEEMEALESMKFVGPAPTMVEDVIDACADMATREDGQPAYPEGALREALCNAIMHRDYSERAQTTHISINVYDDCLEVISPGGLYGLATTDKLESRNTSYTRNQHLADILEVTPYDDGTYMAPSRGTGFLNMRNELAASGLDAPAMFDQITYFKVVIYKAKLKRKATRRYGRKDSEIVEYLRREGEATATDLERNIGLNRRTLNYKLHKLVEQGVIERTGSVHSPKQSYRLI